MIDIYPLTNTVEHEVQTVSK